MSTAVVYRPISVIDFAMRFLGFRDVNRLMTLSPRDKQWKELKAVLKGVRVNVTKQNVPRGGKPRPPRPIKDLIPEAGLFQFSKDNESWNVEVCVLHVISYFSRCYLCCILPSNITSGRITMICCTREGSALDSQVMLLSRLKCA